MLTNGYWLQMKMSQSQHMVAYTLETSPGSEQYIGRIQDVATGDGKHASIVFLVASVRSCSPLPVHSTCRSTRLMAPAIQAGDILDTIDGAACLEFLADDTSIAYTVLNAAGLPDQVCLGLLLQWSTGGQTDQAVLTRCSAPYFESHKY